jgi:hypothetical protein
MPSNKKVLVNSIIPTKREETRNARLEKLNKYFEEGKRITFMQGNICKCAISAAAGIVKTKII